MHITTGRCVGRIDPRDEMLFSVVVKETFHIRGTGLEPAEEPEPLVEEPRLRPVPSVDSYQITTRLPEMVPIKHAPDLVVLGTARAHPSLTISEVILKVGSLATRNLRLQGARVAERQGDSWAFSPPQPWEELPLTWDQAYGGVDPGVGLSGDPSSDEILLASTWHPGAYPRNDLGAGYLTDSAAFRPDTVELPCLEWPDDLLTPERLVCPAPDRWHLQPRPAGFGWMLSEWFPRSVFLGVVTGPWPDQAAGHHVPEETLGLIPAGITEAMKPLDEENLFRPQFWQDAAPGLTLPGLEDVDAITLAGLDNRAHTVVEIPRGRPVVKIPVPGSALVPDLRLLTLMLDLDEGVALRVWAAPVPLAMLEDRGLGEAEVLLNMDIDVAFKQA